MLVGSLRAPPIDISVTWNPISKSSVLQPAIKTAQAKETYEYQLLRHFSNLTKQGLHDQSISNFDQPQVQHPYFGRK